MSDTSQGDGWWLASDGKWYPPEATPGPAAPPSLPPPIVPSPTVPPPVAPSGGSAPLWKRPWFVILGVVIVVLVIAAIATSDPDDEPDSADDLIGDDAPTPAEPDDTRAPTGTDADDFVRCTIVDEETLELEVVNNSSETSSYFITIIFRDGAGTRLGDELQTVNDLRPGERTIESAFSFDLAGTQCEAGDVDRFSTQSERDEVDDAGACEITGRDVFDDLAAAVSVTNNSSETSDYLLTVAFVRDDGVRVGTGSASINAVASGETAPSDVFTTVEAEAELCEIVAVQRFANN